MGIYFPKASKAFRVVKAGCHADVECVFASTGVQLTEDGQNLVHKAGQCNLSTAFGSTEFIAAYLNGKVVSWVAQVERLTVIAATQLHAAYATLIFGLQHRWTFLKHTMPTASEHNYTAIEGYHPRQADSYANQARTE